MNNWEGCRRKQPWPILRVLSQLLSRGTKENHEKPQNIWPVGRALNPEPPRYEVELNYRIQYVRGVAGAVGKEGQNIF